MTSQAGYLREAERRSSDFIDLTEWIDYYAQERPNQIAVKDDEHQLTWADFNQRVSKIAHGIDALNLTAGSRVGILGETNLEYFETFCGALRAGCCVVPLPAMVASVTVKMMGVDADLGVWFVCEKYRYLVKPFEDKMPIKIALDFEAEGWRSYESWITKSPDHHYYRELDPKSEFDIIYSSGTTGTPKGIVHSRQVRFNIYSTGHRLGFWPGSTTFISTLFYSNTTLVTVLRSFANGSKLLLTKKFDVRSWLKTAEKEKVTHTVLVPVQLQRIMAFQDFEKYDLSHFEWVLTTGAPVSPELKLDIVNRWPGRFLEIYGMTEGGVYSFLFANDHIDKLHTVGQPRNHVLKVIDEDGRELPRGEIGELVGRGKTMMERYHNRPEATAATFWQDNEGHKYVRSGDYGAIDEDGFVVLHGRKKEVINSGGFNIYSVDLEEVIKQHEDVAEAIVIGIPSEKWGESPLGLVEAKEGSTADPDEIKEWVNERLGKAQRLIGIEIREKLPRNPIGKILKRELREEYWE